MNNMNEYMKLYDIFGSVEKVQPKGERHPYGKRKSKPAVRLGSTCSKCMMKMSLMGKCFCDEE